MIRIFFLLALTLSLIACAQSTPVRPKGMPCPAFTRNMNDVEQSLTAAGR